MARNIEIKARLANIDAIEALVRPWADHGPEDLQQDDTFFHCAAGRLKLRAFSPRRGELIAYRRLDQPGPKVSDYTIVPVHEPEALRAALAESLGVLGRIRKQRRVYLIGPTRVHLDRVGELGTFLELEVVLDDTTSDAEGQRIAAELVHRLGIADDQLVVGAYLDLWLAQSVAGGPHDS